MYPELFKPGRIGSLTLNNRIIMAPMLTCYTDGEYISDRLIHFLAARAKGGAGLIVTEVAHVNPLGRLEPNEIAIYDDKFLPGLQKLTDAIHDQGSKIAIQIGHGGHRCHERTIGTQPVSASVVTGIWGEEPRELSIDEIKDIVTDFVSAAVRSQQAGFDGVEVHCAHGYLIRQFLSPLTNKRTDEYGGDLEGRARFACEIMEAIKQKVGDYPVWFRINGDEFLEGGQTLDDAVLISRMLEERGADAVSVSAGTYESPQWTCQPLFLEPGCILHLSERIKQEVDIPVIGVGKLNTPELAETALLEDKADFIALGRALIADAEFPVKASEGRANEIRRCIADNVCMDDLIFKGLGCTVNAEVGNEKEYRIQSATDIKNVLIAGGGPGGMEAARVAALRGHRVTLCEKSGVLGGQLNLADKPPFKEEFSEITSYLSGQIEKLGVNIQLNRLVTPEVIEELKPEVVICATGANPIVPDLKGSTNSMVVTAFEVLAGEADVGEKVVVIGGGRVGVEVSEFLAEKGKKVVIVEMQKRIGKGIGLSLSMFYMGRLKELGVTMMPKTRLLEITDEEVMVENEDKIITLESDTVVLAVGAEPDNTLENRVNDQIQLFAIGDCVEPRNMIDTIAEAAKVAREI